MLGLVDPVILTESPDRPNIYIDKVQKKPGLLDCHGMYAAVYEPECDKLFSNPRAYPVTLMYLPLKYMSSAMSYCISLFGKVDIKTACFANVFSNQDAGVKTAVLADLKSISPRIRLVFCTSAIGMGFDSPSITHVIHCKPPRSLAQYLQEIGRAGRAGQRAEALLYYSNSDIAVKGMEPDMAQYCRNDTECHRQMILDSFGFKKAPEVDGCNCCSLCSVSCMCHMCSYTDS